AAPRTGRSRVAEAPGYGHIQRGSEMRKTAYCAIGALLGLSLFGAGSALANDRDRDDHGGKSDRCQLRSDDNRIKHVVYLQFDNVHFRRDNPNIPSDLEQMPNLLNLLEGEG